MDMKQHMAIIERAIGGAFVANGLPVHHLGGIQGPHTLTFALRLYEPTATNLAKAQRMGPAIEAAIGDSPVRIYTERGAIWIETPTPQPATIDGATLRGHGLAVPLGLTSRRAVVGWDAERDPHLLLVGPTGRGKTTAMRLIAYHLARQNHPRRASFIVTTFKPADWRTFGNLAHTVAIVTHPAEAANAMTWLRDTMHRRTAEGSSLPHVFLFVDDLLNLLAVADVTGPLTEIASLGRAAGIHLVIGTQRLGKRGAGDAAITGNIPARLVFGTADAQDAAQFTGRGKSGAELLGRYPGEALFVTDGGTQRMAVGWVDDGRLTKLQQDPSQARPWGTLAGTGQNGSREGATNPAELGEPEPVLNGSGAVLNGSGAVLGGSRTVLAGPARTADELAYVRTTYRRTGSKTRTCKLVWGRKNGETWAWLNQALAETEEVTE